MLTEAGRRLEQRRPGAAEPVEQQHVTSVTHRQGRYAVAADGDVVDAEQRWTAPGESEHAFKADRVIEVAADRQAALSERVDPRHRALAERQPGPGVSRDRDVGAATGRPLANAGGVAGAADLPCVAEVAQLDVVGHVEPRLGTEIALGQGAEALLDVGEVVGVERPG